MTEQEAFEKLRHWAETNNLMSDAVGGEGWKASSYKNVWVLTPPGRTDTIYCVTRAEVRDMHPSRDRLEEVLETMSSDADQV